VKETTNARLDKPGRNESAMHQASVDFFFLKFLMQQASVDLQHASVNHTANPFMDIPQEAVAIAHGCVCVRVCIYIHTYVFKDVFILFYIHFFFG
jgi:hypothetical protein